MRRLLTSLGAIALALTLTAPVSAQELEQPPGDQPIFLPGDQFAPGGECSVRDGRGGEGWEAKTVGAQPTLVFIPDEQFMNVDYGDFFSQGGQFSPSGACFLPAVQAGTTP